MRRKLKVTKHLVVVPPPVVETPSFTATSAVDRLVETANWDITNATKNLKEWHESFDKDPCYAFEWSNTAFSQAARLRSAQEVLRWIEFGRAKQAEDQYAAPTDMDILTETRRIVYEEVIRKSRWPDHSTSVPSNEMSLTLNAARTEWLVKLDDIIKYTKRKSDLVTQYAIQGGDQ